MKIASITHSPGYRALVLTLFYSAVLFLSLNLAYLIRFDFSIPFEYRSSLRSMLYWIIPLQLILLYAFGQFSGLLSYFSLPDLRRLFLAVATGSALMVYVWILTSGLGTPPRGVILADFVFALGGLAGARLAFRVVREKYLSSKQTGTRRARRVGIIGAGDVGANLARELIAKRGLGLNPVAFFDDAKEKWRSRIHDIAVIGPPEDLLKQRLNLQLEKVIIAMPTAPAKRIGEIIRILQTARLEFETVPSIDQLATGKVKVSQLRSVEIQDLLGRAPVLLDTENIRKIIENRVVAVTGAGGSIGSELCRQIAEFNPQRLLLLDQSEVQIFLIEQELLERGFSGIILPLVADILDEKRIRHILERFRPAVLFHAAAHKHVPMMESQPGEALKNNSHGTARLAEWSLEYGVERFVLISTDKAINPTSIMGVSKRLAEIYLQALHATNRNKTKFMAVRFGNVLGSSGSVIPTFMKQIVQGGPVKVTHPEVTRYFMTTPEAVALVLQSCAQGNGGEIFVLDMGKPVKIVDLARQLIELTGFKPGEDIEIEFIGLRPGEKLFEELSHVGENIVPTNHPKIMCFVSEPSRIENIRELFDQLVAKADEMEPDQIKLVLKKAIPEYQPYLV
jgi:FlaA1/EpsC-like NDP-sugar epimerase